ncbi:hypothetical protein DB347_06310 [Opitutaceae bacterium EW11]|nr:hypothetical protein DB347_06310 [Opitutaceae bacterium EW11]
MASSTNTIDFTPLFGTDSSVWDTIHTMATTVSTQTNNVISASSQTDFSDPGAVVLLQMRVNQVTNAATAVSNLVKAIQEPSKNAVSNLR